LCSHGKKGDLKSLILTPTGCEQLKSRAVTKMLFNSLRFGFLVLPQCEEQEWDSATTIPVRIPSASSTTTGWWESYV